MCFPNIILAVCQNQIDIKSNSSLPKNCVFLCSHLLKFLENIFFFSFCITLKINARLSLWNFLDLGLAIQKLRLFEILIRKESSDQNDEKDSMNIHEGAVSPALAL